MNRGFVRTIWGSYGEKERVLSRRPTLDTDMQLLSFNKYEKDLDALTIVFGEDNYKRLIDNGFKCQLADKNPVLWRNTKTESTFRHKPYLSCF